MSDNTKQVIMVLAMARSGTSAITRGLKAVGVRLGDKMHKPDKRNPTGFWEDTDVTYKINRGILRMLDYPWICSDLAERMRVADDQRLNEFKQYAVKLVNERLAEATNWGFKDTNTTTLLPFWQSVLSDVGVEECYVIALRNPLGCAYSNIKHSNLELEAGLMEWLRNLILAIDGTHSKKRMVVSYDLLLNDPQLQLDRMAKDLALVGEPDAHEMQSYAKQFVDKGLHHHSYSESDLCDNPAMAAVPLCLSVYELLMKLAKDEMLFTDSQFYTKWQIIKDEFDRLYPLYHYARSVLKDNHRLEREARRVNKSIPWRIVYPLRLIDNFLRERRRKARNNRRLIKSYG